MPSDSTLLAMLTLFGIVFIIIDFIWKINMQNRIDDLEKKQKWK